VSGRLGRPPGAGARLGRPRLHLRETASTNLVARDLAIAGAPHGTIVTTSHQTAGRGRQGRTWVAPPGRAVLCSLIVRPPEGLLALRGGLAVADLAGAGARVKWPNDVLVEGRKVAGVLAEGRPQEGWGVLGLGVNVAVDLRTLPTELRDTAGTLGRAPSEVETALDELLAALARWIAAPPGEVAAELSRRDALRDTPIRWSGGTGVAAGIDAEGRLLVRGEDGRAVTLESGEVHLLR
jgi:BirA family transcriptional regulator, biotin operon repressor / biotin---[acetyl-CoA-carboxylase] ligase